MTLSEIADFSELFTIVTLLFGILLVIYAECFCCKLQQGNDASYSGSQPNGDLYT